MANLELWIFLITTAFFAGGVAMTTRHLGKRMDNIETHNAFQDQQIAETHTTSQVILVKLDNISQSLAELREDARKLKGDKDD